MFDTINLRHPKYNIQFWDNHFFFKNDSDSMRKRNRSVLLQSVFVLMLFLCFFLVIRNEYEEVERFLKEHRLL